MIKRIETEKDKLKRDKKKQLILAGILIFVMFGSIFGIVVNSFGNGRQAESLTYKGFIFLNENEVYSTPFGNSRFYFSNNPKDADSTTQDVNLEKTLTDYIGETVYVSSPDVLYFNEISGNLYQYVSEISEACKDGENCNDETLPKKTCLDNLIIIKISEMNRIYESSNCVYIEGKEKDLLKLTDKFLLQIIGIK